MAAIWHWSRNILQSPLKVAIIALLLALSSLLFDGTLIDVWTLDQQSMKLQKNFDQIVKLNGELETKIEEARNSSRFIGRQAREKLDLVREDELVFIFENDSFSETPSRLN